MDRKTVRRRSTSLANVPEVRLGLVAVSRDCFPIELSRSRRKKVVEICRRKHIPVTEIETIIEKEQDIPIAQSEMKYKKVNALMVYLGNFGPEVPIAILCQRFEGPVMVCGAAEETGENLYNGRGDAYCGLLSASYNLLLRRVRVHIPENPIGTASEVAEMVRDFIPIARIVIGLRRLKIITFGPRPQDFFTCEAPLKPLLDLGVEIMENSELDMFDVFEKAKGDPMVGKIQAEIKKEIGTGISPDLLEKLARFEVALLRFYENNLGVSDFAVFANKCWPAFEPFFGFVPCYINSRMNGKGIPVACEVDVYGGLSQYIAQAAASEPVTILDINNTVPADMVSQTKMVVRNYKPTDLFMGFHCGNTPGACLQSCSLKCHTILHRLLESGKEPVITYGTLEGRIRPSGMTMVRVHADSGNGLKAYLAEGEVLDIDPRSFGGIGVFAIPEMGRFYRHALISKGFPHHAAVAFQHIGKPVYDALRLVGIGDISVNLPVGQQYAGENPYIQPE